MSKERAKNIKVILFDVDGVLTDGTIWLIPAAGPAGTQGSTADRREAAADMGGYGIASTNIVEAKGFNAHDGSGFSLAKLGGIQLGMVTKRISETVALRARDLKIELLYQGQANKLEALADVCKRTGVSEEEICFVGDDIIDLPVMRRVGLAIAVANAREIVKDEAHFITDRKGGEGAARDAIEYVLRAQGKLDDAISAYIHERIEASAR
ncbi:MAG TPA: HAD hydrolase family protein [Terriglobales bacterium]|jgi:3-deoxy-D-manno-octulosonate 8-phosphate phosphatase (KDO 8-P phosphatase)